MPLVAVVRRGKPRPDWKPEPRDGALAKVRPPRSGEASPRGGTDRPRGSAHASPNLTALALGERTGPRVPAFQTSRCRSARATMSEPTSGVDDSHDLASRPRST